jgi:hypothetical protein
MNRDLLYTCFLSGDGNFHMQSRLQVKDQDKDPSFFGDAGFFVPVKLYHEYFNEADKLQHHQKVSKVQLRYHNN